MIMILWEISFLTSIQITMMLLIHTFFFLKIWYDIPDQKELSAFF